jgi:hypothetical protein
MRTPTRRDALLAGAGGLSAILAGCVGGDGNSGNGNGNGGDPVSVRDVATLDVGSSLAVPYWRRQDEEAVGVVYRYDSSDIQGPDAQALHDSDADVQSFVEATDFETATLLQIGAVGPDTCHNTVDVTGFAVEDGTLVGRASTSAPEGQGCGSAETHPWVLVRVDFDGTPPENAELTITDGWDDEATVSPTTPAGLDPSSTATSSPTAMRACLRARSRATARGSSATPSTSRRTPSSWGRTVATIARRSPSARTTRSTRSVTPSRLR